MGHMTSLLQDETEARSVLQTIKLPADVTGYDLRLGEFGGDPAMWINFSTTIANDTPVPELRSAAARLNYFADQVQTALMQVVPDRFPYIAFTAPK